MTIQEKYAHLQRTVWQDLKTTTLGNLSKEMFDKIESTFAEEAKKDQPPTEPSNKKNTKNKISALELDSKEDSF